MLSSVLSGSLLLSLALSGSLSLSLALSGLQVKLNRPGPGQVSWVWLGRATGRLAVEPGGPEGNHKTRRDKLVLN